MYFCATFLSSFISISRISVSKNPVCISLAIHLSTWSGASPPDSRIANNSEYRTVYDRRQFYVARMESLRLQQRLNARFGPGTDDPSSMFRKLDDRMTDYELEARSLRELRRIGQESALRVGTVLQETIERELQHLKQKLQQGN